MQKKVGGKGCVLIEKLSGCVVQNYPNAYKGARDAEGPHLMSQLLNRPKRLKTMRNLVV